VRVAGALHEIWSAIHPRHGWTPLLILCLLTIFGLFSFATALAAPEVGSDNLAYHLPRLGYWLQFHAVQPFIANNPRIGTFPPNGNILQLLPVLFLRTDRLSGLAQLICCYGTALAIFGIARRIGTTITASALAAFLWFLIPTVLEQIVTSWVDIVLAFFVATALYFVLSYRYNHTLVALMTAITAAALAVGVKTQAAVIALIVGLFCLWQVYRHHNRTQQIVFVLVASASTFLLALTFYIQNYLLFGHISGLAAAELLHVDPGMASLSKNMTLILSPISFWLWRDTTALDPAIPYKNAVEALRSDGLGIAWLSLCIASVAYITIKMLFRRNSVIVLQSIVIGIGVGFLLFILFFMRHQPSTNRFVLAAVVIITPAFAVLYNDLISRSRIARSVVSCAIFIIGIYLLQYYALDNFSQRLTDTSRAEFSKGNIASISFLQEQDRYTAPLEPFVRGVADISSDHGIRIGLLTPQYSPEGFLFGKGYRNTLIPRSYTPPRTVADLDNIHLDALWIQPTVGYKLQLWKMTLPEQPVQQAESWKVTTFTTYDQDFLNAYGQAVFYEDVSPIINALGQPSSGWHVVYWNDAGVLFAHGADTTDDLQIVSIKNPNGLETYEDAPFFWIGQGETEINVFADHAGRIDLVGEFIFGPSLPNAQTRRIQMYANGILSKEIVITGATRKISAQVVAGKNVLAIRALDEPTVLTTGDGDHRPLLLGVKNIRVQWEQP